MAVCVLMGAPAATPKRGLYSSPLMIHRGSYTVLYDVNNGVPAAVWWMLEYRHTQGKPRGGQSYFKSDPAIPKPRPKHTDYNNSGYQRGHMCPAADRRWSKAECRSTFIMSNCAPQTIAVNTGAWLEIENRTRYETRRTKQVAVACGSLFHSSVFITTASATIRIPSSYWKIVYRLHPDTLVSVFQVPNDTVFRCMDDCRITLDSLRHIVPDSILRMACSLPPRQYNPIF